MDKIIVLDWGIFLHRAVFASVNNPDIPTTYTAMSMILGNLKRIGVNPEDTIIVAVDARHSWRKDYEFDYKGDRKKKREGSPIDWKYHYQKFDELLETLEITTNWHIIKIDHLEADDIMAVTCRYFKDKEVVLVTYDSDLEQCWAYENVKIFSPKAKKWKLRPDNFNAYKVISKKVQKEASDNLTSPILNEEDYYTRLTCITLLELPEWVENAVKKDLDNIEDRVYYPEHFPFNGLKDRYMNLYTNKKDIIIYEDQLHKAVQKEARKKRKKLEEKAKEKRRKEREKKKLQKEKK